MKTTSILFAAISLLCLEQACGPKAKENSNISSVSEGDSVANVQIEADAKKAERQKMLEERRKSLEARKAAETYDIGGTTVYNRVAVKPEFKGGKDAMNKYFKDNLKYPEGTQWQGTLVVDFVVDPNGRVQHAEVTQDIDTVEDELCRNEAIRVVSSMPTWVAGKQNGKNVAASYSLPVTFQQQ